ncbi:MAG: hypothetical protein NTW67_02660 [Candidatus Woesearchaeota archaeon]|nr:hypothetical protein [Candidatus Woesearchaeota archaeon]
MKISDGTVTQLTSGAFDDGPGSNWAGIIDCGSTDVVFSRFDGSNWQIAKVPIATGAVTMLTSNIYSSENPRYNDDYTKIVYSGYVSASDIISSNSDGSNVVIHTTAPGITGYYLPMFCPDATDTIYAIHHDVSHVDWFTQITPVPTDLYLSTQDPPQCYTSPGYDYFFTQNDGSNDQFWEEDFDDPPVGLVPEFSTITLLLAALIALGGIFAFRKYR